MRLAAPHDSPPAGIRLRNSTANPTTAIVATRGVSRWLLWNNARAVPNARELDECEGREDRLRQRQVDEPEEDGDRHEHQRHRDRRPLSDPKIRLVRGIGTDVENANWASSNGSASPAG